MTKEQARRHNKEAHESFERTMAYFKEKLSREDYEVKKKYMGPNPWPLEEDV